MPSKLGFHFLRKGGPDPDRVAAAGCRIVKVVHDHDNLVNRFRQRMPEATIIVRNFIGLSGEDDFLRWGGHRDPKGAAAAAVWY